MNKLHCQECCHDFLCATGWVERRRDKGDLYEYECLKCHRQEWVGLKEAQNEI